jgi:hypothetical protein
MRERLSPNLGAAARFSSWPMALIGIVVIKAVLSLAVKPGSFLVSYSGISYFLLLLLATSLAVRNGIQNTLRSRPFWVFLAIAYGLWALDQGLFLYYELGLYIEVPDNSIADPVLFPAYRTAYGSCGNPPAPERVRPQAIPDDLKLSSLAVFLELSFCLRRLSVSVLAPERHRLRSAI